MVLSYLSLLALALQPALATCQYETTPPTATTLNGTYTGSYLPKFSQDIFRGIPYARAHRLRNPAPWDESWEGSRSAEYYGPACYSLSYEKYLLEVNVTSVSEECLSLNIIRPSLDTLKPDAKLPVAVWFHGGGFIAGFGAGHSSNYSYIVQASMAQGMPIMAVTLNYRLGFLGFPGGAEAEAEGVTNLGLKDQRQALRWIQENIAAFGGDPEKVTLWGQSAGAVSIAQQILAYGGQSNEKLFRGAIMISGSVGIGNTLHPTRADYMDGYRSILSATGCLNAEGILNCLRKVPIDQLWNASLAITTFPTSWPMVDGDFVAKPPTLQLLAGELPRDVSILAGTNNDEGLGSAQAFGPATETDEELFQLLRNYIPFARNETIELVMSAYPVDAPSPPYSMPMTDNRFCEAMAVAGLPCGAQYRRIAAIFGDLAQIHGRRIIARKFAELGMTAYTYRSGNPVPAKYRSID
jgi:carboxylesterase type B